MNVVIMGVEPERQLKTTTIGEDLIAGYVEQGCSAARLRIASIQHPGARCRWLAPQPAKRCRRSPMRSPTGFRR